jgi:peptide/nickel transport system substrate-binding protein
MERISRRQIVRGGAATAATVTLSAPSLIAQQNRPTLRFAAHADLKVLDPVWTTAYITRNHSYLVYDTLFGMDENLQVQPQMVDQTTVSPDSKKYTFTLRDGLRWHDGQPVLSEDCVESLKRWGKTNRFGQLLMAHTGKIASVDKSTFTLELTEHFGPVLEALGNPRAPFMIRRGSRPRLRKSRSRKLSAPDRSSSRGTSGNPANRSCTCATPTTSRAMRRRAGPRAARRCTLIR